MLKWLKSRIGITIVSLLVLGIVLIPFANASNVVPPTNAVQMINGTGGNVTAFSWNGFITFLEGAGISFLFDYDNSELTISSGAGSATFEQLTNVTDDFCTTNQVRKASGNQWICANDNTGSDTTTASNVGTGLGVFEAEVGDDLQFNSLLAGAFLTITDTIQDLTIDFDGMTLENLLNVTDGGCALNQVRKVDGAGNWICANDIDTSGGITTLESLTNVTDTGCALNEIRKVSGTSWICAVDNVGDVLSFEQLSNVTDTGCATGQVRKVSGANWVCANDDTGAGAIDIISEGNSNVEVIDLGTGEVQIDVDGVNEFRFLTNLLDAFGATLDNIAIFISNAADPADAGVIQLGNTEIIAWESNPASTDLTITSDASENFIFNSGWNILDMGLNAFNNAIFDVAGIGNRLTSTSIALGDILKSDGTDFKRFARGGAGLVLKVNAGGTDLEWATDNTGAGGSGIPLPPKKWGAFYPRSTSLFGVGLVAGCTMGATASFVYDTTDNSNALLSTTAITDGVNCGIGCVVSNTNSFRGDQNAYMYARWEENKITTNRIFIGFSSSATLLPNNADTILDAISGAGLCIRTTDTVYQFCSNDGTGAMAVASLTTSEDTGVHFFEVYTTDAGVTWCGKLDGGTAVCSSTAANIPAVTTRLYAMSQGETDGGATAILWTQYQFYIQSDK